MEDESGQLVAAPVIMANYSAGSRVVTLDFEPTAGYWESVDGIALLRSAAAYAQEGASTFSIESQVAACARGNPDLTVHLRPIRSDTATGTIATSLTRVGTLLDSVTIPVAAGQMEYSLPFHKPLAPGSIK